MSNSKVRFAVVLGAVGVFVVGAAVAQDITRQELLNFDRFLDSHPAIQNDLRTHPELAKDPNYLSSHPDLKTFLDTHPGVREEIRENPKRFVNRERAFEKSGKDISRTEARNFDDFLDGHPAVEKELRKNPSLANDPNYLAKHPELKNFLSSHPRIQQDLRSNPRAMIKAERKVEKREHQEAKEQRREERREERSEERREFRAQHGKH